MQSPFFSPCQSDYEKNFLLSNVMRCAIWYHSYNLKNMKNTHGGVLILKPATLLKLTPLLGCFSHFLNCTNGTKARNAPQMFHDTTPSSNVAIPIVKDASKVKLHPQFL